MKIAAFALTTVLSSAVVLGFVFAIVVFDEEQSVLALIVAATATMAFVVAGIVGGMFLVTSGRDPRTPDGRRFFVRVAMVLAAVVLAASIALVIVVALGELSPAVAAVSIGSGAVYIGLNVGGGEYLRRRDERLRPTRPTPTPLDPDLTRRRIRTAAWLFVAIVLAGVFATAIVWLTTGDAEIIAPVLGLAVLLAALAAGFVCLSVVFRLNAVGREILGTDATRAKRIGRFIRGEGTDLPADEEAIALRYAPTGRSLVAWNAAQFILLYLGLFAQNAGRLLGPPSDLDPFSAIFAVALVIIGAILIPTQVVRYRRIGRFIASQGRLEAPPPDPAAQSPR